MPEQAEMKMTKRMYKAEDVYRGSGRVFGLCDSLEKALNRVTYTRKVESLPKAFFSKITVFECEATGKKGDTLIWGENKVIEIINLV